MPLRQHIDNLQDDAVHISTGKYAGWRNHVAITGINSSTPPHPRKTAVYHGYLLLVRQRLFWYCRLAMPA
eukprot:1677839-Lingulodinium_polyedra.AAC.1